MRSILKFIMIMMIFNLLGCASGGGSLLGMAGLVSFQNEPDGFRGIKWGQSRDSVKGLYLVKSQGEPYTIYTRDNDSLLLGDAELTKMEYLFWHDQFLAGRAIATAGKLQALKNVLTIKFGDGTKMAPYIEDYSWAGPVALIKLNRLNFMSDCVVTITSRDINDQMNIDLGGKAKAGAERGARQDF